MVKNSNNKKITKIGSTKDAYEIVDQLVNNEEMSSEVGGIIKDTIALAKMVNKADQAFRFTLDVNNINADIATAQNNLMNKIANAKTHSPNSVGLNLSKISAEESLIMCASGKDRTGFAQHDFTARGVKSYIEEKSGQEISLSELDNRILKSGHTASQAGNPYAGGATIGCHGTKIDNLQSLPMSRFRGLQGIIEASSSGNNLPTKIPIAKQITVEKDGATTLDNNISVTKQSLAAKMQQKIFLTAAKKSSTKDVLLENPSLNTKQWKSVKPTKSKEISTELKERELRKLKDQIKKQLIQRTNATNRGIIIGRQRLKPSSKRESSNQR